MASWSDREKRLALLTGGVLGLGLVYVTGIKPHWERWRLLSGDTAVAEREIERLEAQIRSNKHYKKDWQSLRPELERSDPAAFRKHLEMSIAREGLQKTFNEGSPEAKREVGGQVVPFSLTLEGGLAALARILAQMDAQSGFLRLPSLSVAQGRPGQLTVTAIASTLALAGGARPAGPASPIGTRPGSARERDKVVAGIVEKNIFAPWREKPATPAPSPRKNGEGEKPKEVREELVVTGIFYDNVTNAYSALVESRDGERKMTVTPGSACGKYKVKVVLHDRLGLVEEPGGKAVEVFVGGTFEGAVLTREEMASRARAGATSTTTDKAAPVPQLTDTKRNEVLERLKARRKAEMDKGKK